MCEHRPSPQNSVYARSSKICHGNADCLIDYFIINFSVPLNVRFQSNFQFYFIIVFPPFFHFLLTFNFKCRQEKYRSEDRLGHVTHLGHGLTLIHECSFWNFPYSIFCVCFYIFYIKKICPEMVFNLRK